METKAAVAKLSALAHASRLQAYRLLVRAGPGGLPAGEIALALDVPPPTLSFHLRQLIGAGLASTRRDGKSVIYAIDVEGMRALLAYLAEDCCEGRPDLCAPLALAKASASGASASCTEGCDEGCDENQG